jgi:hypothetical protein
LQPDAVGSLKRLISELNTQPTDTPVQRFGRSLAAALAWLGARAVRYAFPVRLFHSLLHAGLSRRIQELRNEANPGPAAGPRRIDAGAIVERSRFGPRTKLQNEANVRTLLQA